MYKLIKKIIANFAQIDIFWRLCNATIIPFAFHLSSARNRPMKEAAAASRELALRTDVSIISNDLTVQHGPFSGMKYPNFRAIGSAFAPKILGSYERELHEVFATILTQDYSEVVDIGCAEGYYAVGFARAMVNAQVYAYDIDKTALNLAQSMGELNGVSERLHFDTFCSPNTLIKMEFRSKALIFCDCEGYELELFNSDVINALSNHDFLIETHDFLNIETSEKLKNRFSATHNIHSIFSIDDLYKAHNYKYKELEGFSLRKRFDLLAEHRPCSMEWLFMQPKDTQRPSH